MKKAENARPASPAAQLMAIEIFSGLLVSTSPQKLGEALTDHLRELSGARTVMVLAHRPEPALDELLHASPLRRAELFSPTELNLFCFEKFPDKLPFKPDELPVHHPLKTLLLQAGIQSMARFALRAGGELVGLLLLFDLPGVERIAETNQIITLLAPPIALALKNALAYFLIEQQAQELEQRIEERTEELREKNAELQKKNSEIKQFIYTVSHDLRSPLVTVKAFMGYLESDMAGNDQERVAQDMQFIHGAADKMKLLLDELLEMSRIGRVETPPVRVSLKVLLVEVLDVLAGVIKERKVDIRLPDTDLMLFGDRLHLCQIWQNLIENAIKYCRDGSIPCIELGVQEESGETLFFVRDNGIGIDPRYHSKVFEIFEKLNPKSPGAGLGLSMIQQIVKKIGGRVWVESEGSDKGSCFRFTLPGAVSIE